MPPKGKAITIYETLKKQIISGTPISEHSLTQGRIAEQFGISRNTAKKVLLMLQNDGLLNAENSKSATLYSYSLDEVLSLQDLRAVLEGYIVSNATLLITKKQLSEMEKILKKMDEHIENRRLMDYINCNEKFHAIIKQACNNPVALKMLEQLTNQLRKYGRKTILIPGRDRASLQEHHEILEALKAREPDLASEKMQLHIHNLRDTFKNNAELLM